MEHGLQSTFADRFSKILEDIRFSAEAVGRDPSDVTLVGACKRQTDEIISESLAAGLRVYGENRVQEAQSRWETFSGQRKAVELHLIGPVQTNKAEDAVRLFDIIESLDRPKLAKALAVAADKVGNMPQCWIQVNTGEEPQKAGVLPMALDEFLTEATSVYEIPLSGLMCIPPKDQPAGPHFAFLRKMADEHGLKNVSMGMSGDFQTAIMFGATHVRIGSALFGERDT